MAYAAAAAIRDRAHSLIESLTPISLNSDKFRRWRSEGVGDFTDWAEKNPAACLRRFQIREVGDDEPPVVSNLTEERVVLTLELRVAYPQTMRFGGDNALDRDDVIAQDWKSIKYELCGTGGDARNNFTTSTTDSYDCTPLPAVKLVNERGEGVDIMVARLQFTYIRSTDADIDPLAGVVLDSTSGKYIPSSAHQWDIVLAQAGITSGGPTSLWRMQESAGTLADSIASNSLSVAGVTYQTAVAGWTRTAMSSSDGGTGLMANGSIADVGTYSAMLFLLVAVGPTIGGTRDICGLGGGGTYRGAQVTTTPAYKATPNDGSASLTGTSNAGNTVHPVIVRVNRTAGSFTVITDQEVISQSPYTAPPAPSPLLFIGSALTTTPQIAYLYGAYFQGTAAEMTNAQLRALLTTLAWPTDW